ncbi:MAG: hypothetical protein GEV08_19580 [Acidimicrobiia bacterium]|nr:hypothetical protein [Acidimicrobiia bacterium]
MIGEHEHDRRLLVWHGVDPERVDAADVQLGPDRLRARGTSLAPGYALSYRLATGPAWATRELGVRVEGDGWWRTLELRRGDDGEWSLRRREGPSGGAGAARAQVAGVDAAGVGAAGRGEELALPELAGALDCDLGLCLLTNTMPVRREGLVAAARDRQARRAELTMAWVAVPELVVSPAAQAYESVPRPGGPPRGSTAAPGAVVRFSSGDFTASIELDADGLVVDYPGIGRRVALSR